MTVAPPILNRLGHQIRGFPEGHPEDRTQALPGIGYRVRVTPYGDR